MAFKAHRHPRDARGRYIRLAPQVDVAELYRWRDAWRDYQAQVDAAATEARWGGIRSLAIFGLMSAALVGLLLTNL